MRITSSVLGEHKECVLRVPSVCFWSIHVAFYGQRFERVSAAFLGVLVEYLNRVFGVPASFLHSVFEGYALRVEGHPQHA